MLDKRLGCASAAVWGLVMLTVGAGAAAGAPLTPGNIALHEGGSVIVLDASTPSSPTVVATLSDTLPSSFAFHGGQWLAWGDDGHLYQYAILDRGSGDEEGAIEYDGSGYVAFHPAGTTVMGAEGFAVAPDGSMLVADRDRDYANPPPYVRAYSRSIPGAYDELTPLDTAWMGDDGLGRSGSMLAAVGNRYVALYDLDTLAQTSWFATSDDNDRVAVSPDGPIAVNFQWAQVSQPGFTTYVEVFDSSGAWLQDIDLPVERTTRDLAFDSEGRLYVLSYTHDRDLGRDVDPVIYVYDTSFALAETIDLSGFSDSIGNFVVILPEPGTLALVGSGLALVAARRRRRSRRANRS